MKILVVDDADASRNALGEALETEGHAISVAPNAAIALKLARIDPPDLILLDIVLPDMDGIQVCHRLKEVEVTSQIPVIFITAKDEMVSMEKGFEAGAVDYITKPFNIREVSVRVQTHLRLHCLHRELEQSNRELKDSTARLQREIAERQAAEAALHTADEKLKCMSQVEMERWGVPSFIGESSIFRQILGDIRRLHQFETTHVLVSGESGTGKELVARAIHFGSANGEGPFIPVNCSAIPPELAESLLFGHVRGSFTGAHQDRKGCFELAEGGTLFLDEIGDMPLMLQAKLLRAVESNEIVPIGETSGRKVQVRIIAASNVDFPTEIANGRFRQDLYFRLARFTLTVPPLRDRREDVPLLVRHFLDIFSREMNLPRARIHKDAMTALLAYDFPGNVRELKNVVEGALIRCGGGEVLPHHLQFFSNTPSSQIKASPDSDFMSVRKDQEEQIIDYIREHGSINNLQCRQCLKVNRDRASYLLKKMAGEDRLRRKGEGRWAEYYLSNEEPGAKKSF